MKMLQIMLKNAVILKNIARNYVFVQKYYYKCRKKSLKWLTGLNINRKY